MPNQPFAIGQGAVLQVFHDGQKFGDALDVMSWNLTHDVEAVQDGVNGEDADRLDHIHKSWTLNITSQFQTLQKVEAYLNYRASVEGQSTPDQVVGISLTPRGKGNAILLSLSECSMGGLGLSSGGRTNRLQMTVPIKARYMNKIN